MIPDEQWMKMALEQAERAALLDEVPVGAIVVRKEIVVGQGHNQRETARDPTAHAEIIALRAAAEQVGNWRLDECVLYVTQEPCPMCAGAIVNARVQRLVYGCDNPKAGAVRTLFQIVDDVRLNHRVQVSGGVLRRECAERLTTFFQRLRLQGKK